MTSDQGLLVIHLPSLHRVSMATAAGLSYPSWTHRYIPFEWCMGLEDGGTLFCYLHLHVLGFTKLHEVVQMTALLETHQDNTDY